MPPNMPGGIACAWQASDVPRCITLTTDFGTRDPYVAAVKGVMLSQCPSATLIDLTHDIPPQDIMEGALFLAASAPYFPPGTVHFAVVDPGVGTERLGMVARVGEWLFVGPDNGLVSILAARYSVEAWAITNSDWMRDPVSPTFHGRDVFAPAAARLAAGAPPEEAGPRIETPVRLQFPAPIRIASDSMQGVVAHVDRFGNAISNVSRASLGGAHIVAVEVGGRRVAIGKTYNDVASGELVALFGSSDYLELSVNGGSAAQVLNLEHGAPVEVFLTL